MAASESDPLRTRSAALGVDAFSPALFWIDEAGTVAEVNESGCTLLRASREEVTGRDIASFFPGAEVCKLADEQTTGTLLAPGTWRESLAIGRGDPLPLELGVVRTGRSGADSACVWAVAEQAGSEHARSEPASSGRVISEQALPRDALPTKKLASRPIAQSIAPDAAHPRNESFPWQSLLAVLADVVQIVDEGGLIVYANRAYRGRAALVGARPADFVPPSLRPQLVDVVNRAREQRQPASIDIPAVTIEGAFGWQRYNVQPIEDTVHAGQMMIAVRDVDTEKQTGALLSRAREELNARLDDRAVAFSQITARLEAEQLSREEIQKRLRYQEALAQLILASIAEGVVLVDDQGEMVLVNPAAQRMLGPPVADSRLSTWAQHLDSRLPDKTTEYPITQLPLSRAMRGEAVDDAEMFLAGLDRPRGKFIQVAARPLRNSDEVIVGSVAVFRDITRQKQSAEALLERAELAGFTADVSIALTATESLPAALARCAQSVVRRLKARAARIWILRPKSNELELQAAAGLPADPAAQRIEVGDRMAGHIAHDRLPKIAVELSKSASGAHRRWATENNVKLFSGYPLIVEQQVVGVLAAYSDEPLSNPKLDALASGADTIALAIQHRWADDALRTSERRFRDLAESISEVFWLFNADGTEVEYVSPAYQKVFGLSQPPLHETLEQVLNIVHPDDIERLQSSFAATAPAPWSEDYRISRPDGSPRWIRGRTFPVSDGEGNIQGLVGVAEDITDRKVAEAELEKHAARQQALAEFGRLAVAEPSVANLSRHAVRLASRVIEPDGCGVCEISTDGRQLVIRAHMGPEEVKVDETSAAIEHALGGLAIETGQTVTVSDMEQEPSPHRTFLAGYGIMSAVWVPLRLSQGFFGTLGAWCYRKREYAPQDVRFLEVMGQTMAVAIERQRTASLLRDSEARLRALFDTTPDGILVVDRQGTILFINRPLPGIPLEGAVGKSSFAAFLPQDHARYESALARAFDMGERSLLEHQTEGDSWRISRVTPLVWDDNRPAAMVISQDITRRKLADLNLIRNQHLLRQSLLAHERDRQLISYEIHDGMVQDVTGALLHLEAFEHSIAGLNEDTRRGLHLVINLLRRTIDEGRRLISGLRPPIIDEQGIVAAIEYLIGEANEQSPLQVQFVCNIQSERFEPMVEGAVFRIVQETLSNIRRHSQSSRAQIKLLQVGERLHLSIRDWGVGFDVKQVQERRFGLRGMRERVKLLKGRFRLESSPDKGTRVVVELPLHWNEPEKS